MFKVTDAEVSISLGRRLFPEAKKWGGLDVQTDAAGPSLCCQGCEPRQPPRAMTGMSECARVSVFGAVTLGSSPREQESSAPPRVSPA